MHRAQNAVRVQLGVAVHASDRGTAGGDLPSVEPLRVHVSHGHRAQEREARNAVAVEQPAGNGGGELKLQLALAVH